MPMRLISVRSLLVGMRTALRRISATKYEVIIGVSVAVMDEVVAIDRLAVAGSQQQRDWQRRMAHRFGVWFVKPRMHPVGKNRGKC